MFQVIAFGDTYKISILFERVVNGSVAAIYSMLVAILPC